MISSKFDRKFEITDEEALPDSESFGTEDSNVSIPNFDKRMQIQIIASNPVHYVIVHARDLKSQRLMEDASPEESRLKLINAIFLQESPSNCESMNLIYVLGSHSIVGSSVTSIGDDD